MKGCSKPAVRYGLTRVSVTSGFFMNPLHVITSILPSSLSCFSGTGLTTIFLFANFLGSGVFRFQTIFVMEGSISGFLMRF